MLAQAPHPTPGHSPARHNAPSPAAHPSHPAHAPHPSHPKPRSHITAVKPTRPHPTPHKSPSKPSHPKSSAPRHAEADLEAGFIAFLRALPGALA